MSNLTVFSTDNALVSYNDKKGAYHQLSAEGALFKGGAALRALKDVAMQSAHSKAEAGSYRSASDILAGAFPTVARAVDKVIGTPWANKSAMGTFLMALDRADEPAKGWSKKQIEARLFISALRQLPAFSPEQVTINA
mgnify:CR=1 FL=1